jgi:hypothetical protein
LAWDSWKAEIAGKKVDGQRWSSSKRGKGVSERNLFFRVNKWSGRIDISVDVESYVSRSSTKIVFNNVSPSNLPVTRKAGTVSVTLKKAFYGKANDEEPYYTADGRDQFGVTYVEAGPPDNFGGTFSLASGGGWSQNCSGPDPYWRLRNIRLSVNGKAVASSGAIGDFPPGGASDAFQAQTEKLTRAESVASIFSRKLASRMITRRATREAVKYPRKFRTKQYYDAHALPARFTWSAEVPPPPKDRRYAHIVFKGIPLPPQ